MKLELCLGMELKQELELQPGLVANGTGTGAAHGTGNGTGTGTGKGTDN